MNTPLRAPTPSWWFRLEALMSFVLRSTMESRLKRAIRTARLDHLQRLLDSSAWEQDTPLTPLPPDRSRHLGRVHTGHTLLHYAVAHGDYAVVDCLIARGASINASTDWGVHVVQTAAVHGHAHLVALLASHGADVERGFPSFSTFYDGDYVGPTCAEILKRDTGMDYQGNEHVVYRAALLEQNLPPAAPSASGLVRARL